jgi:hypothetical protein
VRLISDAWKNQFALAAVSHFAENCQRWIGKRHAVILVHLHPLARNFPDCAWPINFGPPNSEHFVRPTNCKNQKAECPRRAAIGAGQLRHELRYFGVGQGGVMTGLTLRPLRKLFPKLLCQFGGIAKLIVVDVDILRDYRFDAPADTVRGSRASRSKSA